LPRAEQLYPYLKTIDANRWHTNRGELVIALETRLGDLLGAGSAKVITANSGTAAIEAAVLAVAGRAAAEPPCAASRVYVRRNGCGDRVLRLPPVLP
jgi:dTDP-4-amino-4,6-dideoxygalactose transaminase